MTLSDVQSLVASVDPDVRHYFVLGQGQDYTYWEETGRLPITSDDGHDEGWRFTVHRFTKQEGDAIAAAIWRALEKDARVACSYLVANEPDTGYIHHVFDCEGY